MKFKLFQVKAEPLYKDLLFRDLPLEQNVVDASAYTQVYSETCEEMHIESLYYRFNCDIPEDFKGRSMSVSDVIYISDSEKTEEGYYFCSSIGFRKVGFVEWNAKWESLKQILFEEGYDAISAFLGYDYNVEESKDCVENRLDEAYEQMPPEELERFYRSKFAYDYKGVVKEVIKKYISSEINLEDFDCAYDLMKYLVNSDHLKTLVGFTTAVNELQAMNNLCNNFGLLARNIDGSRDLLQGAIHCDRQIRYHLIPEAAQKAIEELHYPFTEKELVTFDSSYSEYGSMSIPDTEEEAFGFVSVDGFPEGEDPMGKSVVSIWLSKNGKFSEYWKLPEYQNNCSVRKMVNEAKAKLRKAYRAKL